MTKLKLTKEQIKKVSELKKKEKQLQVEYHKIDKILIKLEDDYYEKKDALEIKFFNLEEDLNEISTEIYSLEYPVNKCETCGHVSR